jgi:hypothetical protein
MKEQVETAVPRRKFVAGDSEEVRKTAIWHCCNPLCLILESHFQVHLKAINKKYLS